MNKIRAMRKIFAILLAATLFTACEQKKDQYNPYAIKSTAEKKQKNTFEVDFKKTESNLKTIHVKLNDKNGYDALFDTGCSGMLISSMEFDDLIKSQTITVSDYVGVAVSFIADGSEIKNPIYNIRSVTVVDKKGEAHVLRDIKATVVENPGAAILIGNSLIDQWAKNSYTIDLTKKVIRFQ